MALPLCPAAAAASVAVGIGATAWGVMLASRPIIQEVVEPVKVYVDVDRDGKARNNQSDMLLDSIQVGGVEYNDSMQMANKMAEMTTRTETATHAQTNDKPTADATTTVSLERLARAEGMTLHQDDFPDEYEIVTTLDAESGWRCTDSCIATLSVMIFIVVVILYGKHARMEMVAQQQRAVDEGLKMDIKEEVKEEIEEEIKPGLAQETEIKDVASKEVAAKEDLAEEDSAKEVSAKEEPPAPDSTTVDLTPFIRQLEELKKDQEKQNNKIDALEQANKAKDVKIAEQERRLNERIDQAHKTHLQPLELRVDGLSKYSQRQLDKIWNLALGMQFSYQEHQQKVIRQFNQMDGDIAMKVSQFFAVEKRISSLDRDLTIVWNALIKKDILRPAPPNPQATFVPPPPPPPPSYPDYTQQHSTDPQYTSAGGDNVDDDARVHDKPREPAEMLRDLLSSSTNRSAHEMPQPDPKQSVEQKSTQTNAFGGPPHSDFTIKGVDEFAFQRAAAAAQKADDDEEQVNKPTSWSMSPEDSQVRSNSASSSSVAQPLDRKIDAGESGLEHTNSDPNPSTHEKYPTLLLPNRPIVRDSASPDLGANETSRNTPVAEQPSDQPADHTTLKSDSPPAESLPGAQHESTTEPASSTSTQGIFSFMKPQPEESSQQASTTQQSFGAAPTQTGFGFKTPSASSKPPTRNTARPKTRKQRTKGAFANPTTDPNVSTPIPSFSQSPFEFKAPSPAGSFPSAVPSKDDHKPSTDANTKHDPENVMPQQDASSLTPLTPEESTQPAKDSGSLFSKFIFGPTHNFGSKAQEMPLQSSQPSDEDKSIRLEISSAVEKVFQNHGDYDGTRGADTKGYDTK